MAKSKIVKAETQLALVDIENLIPADWNYKTEGTEEEIDKLIRSIEKDRSAGVLAIREIKKGKKTLFEVMDGNHRLQAVKKMGWKKVPCENFGDIDDADAITLAKRRNHNWFADDLFKLQDVFNEKVFAKYSVDQLAEFMPDSRSFLESLAGLGELPWDKPPEETPGGDGKNAEKNAEFVEFKIKIPNETMEVWHKLKARYDEALGETQPDYRVFEFALIEALNVPDEKLGISNEEK